jgi:30S ribosomal protein S31
MGRGDKRTRRGKIFKGSYGNTRPQGTESVKQAKSSGATPAKKTTATKKSK